MSYQDDPNINRRNLREDTDTGYVGWIVGGLLAVALIIGGLMMFGRDNTNTASNNTNRPAASAPTTTGSGSSMPTPQRDVNKPAPAPAPAPAR
jgi:hypothetical protein